MFFYHDMTKHRTLRTYPLIFASLWFFQSLNFAYSKKNAKIRQFSFFLDSVRDDM